MKKVFWWTFSSLKKYLLKFLLTNSFGQKVKNCLDSWKLLKKPSTKHKHSWYNASHWDYILHGQTEMNIQDVAFVTCFVETVYGL